MNCNKNDVITVTKALLYFGVNIDCCGWYVCDCCDGKKVGTKKEFRHDKSCPILVAQDILTRFK